MRTFTWELALTGLLVVGTGCTKDEPIETGETGGDEVPTVETDCGDGDDEDEDGDEDCEDSDCVGEEECMFVPFMITATGFFAYTANDEVTSYLVGGVAQAPSVVITLGTEDFGDTQDVEQDTCEILISYTGTAPLALETDTAGGRIVTLPGAETEMIDESCTALSFDPEVLGTVEEIAGLDWQLRVTEDVNADASKAADSQDITEYVGGAWGSPSFGDFVDYGITIAYEIDQDGNLLNTDGNILDPANSKETAAQITAADIVAVDSVLAPGAYTVASMYFVSFQ